MDKIKFYWAYKIELFINNKNSNRDSYCMNHCWKSTEVNLKLYHRTSKIVSNISEYFQQQPISIQEMVYQILH